MNIFHILHNDLNKPLSIYLNSFTDNNIIGNIVYIFSDLPIFILPIFLVGYWLYFNYIKYNVGKNKLLFIFYSTILTIIINLFIQQFIFLDRPEESLISKGKLILSHIPDNSFPSDHASIGSAFLTSLFLFGFIKLGLIFTPFMIIMFISRVAGGIHWPFDILIGIIIGILSSLLIYKYKNSNILLKINNFILKLFSYFKL